MFNPIYHDLASGKRETTLTFMIRSVLQSRTETGLETSDDEDANVYIAGLLASFLDPKYHRRNRHRVSPYDAIVAERARSAGGDRERFGLYRVNADYYLMTLGIFPNLLRHRPRGGRRGGVSPENIAHRARTYYHFAAGLGERLSGRGTGLSVVLEKLCRQFDVYLRVLEHMRAEVLHFRRRQSRGEKFHLDREIDQILNASDLPKCRDAFLDAYLAWRQTRSEADRQRVHGLAQRLRHLDPEFRFPSLPGIEDTPAQ